MTTDRIAELECALNEARLDRAHYEQVCADLNALYEAIEAVGVVVYETDRGWAYNARGFVWGGHATAVEATRQGLLRLKPR